MFGHAFIPMLFISTFLALNSEHVQRSVPQPGVDIPVPETKIVMTVNAEDINGMNIILNDADCSDTFFQDVVTKLEDDGINVTTTQDCRGINQDNVTVITLDQQYSAGNNTMIFAPYDNTRIGSSDSLALSMQAAFEQEGMTVSPILCGKVGFQQDENGNVAYSVPTVTEVAMDEDCDSSFVTISLGTGQNDPEAVAKGIENGLARQSKYLESDDHQTDLIYRANPGDSIDGVSDYFGTDASRLRKFNDLSTDQFGDSQTVINPYVEDMNAFDDGRYFQVGNEDVKTY